LNNEAVIEVRAQAQQAAQPAWRRVAGWLRHVVLPGVRAAMGSAPQASPAE